MKGLRAQFSIGLIFLLVVILGATAFFSEKLQRRQMLSVAVQSGYALAEAVASGHEIKSRHVKDVWNGARSEDAAFGRVPELFESSPNHVLQNDTLFIQIKTGETFVVVATDASTLQRSIERHRQVMWPLYLGTGFVIFIFAFAFFGFVVMRPVRAIRVATERVADGDFAAPIKRIPNNEFGEVAKSFNAMLGKLETNRSALEQRLAELEKINSELSTTQNSLVRSEKLASVGQLAAGIAHEIGNPLAAVAGYNELLEDNDLTDAERHELVERTQVQIDRILHIIRNLLDYSREEDTTPEPTDLAHCVDESLSLVKALPKARRIAFIVEPSENVRMKNVENSFVHANGPQVVQILVNLCVNAIDAFESAGKSFGTIRFQVVYHGDRTSLTVSDNGPGIPADVVGRIFDPFFTTKEPGRGTGLGLSIALKIMERFGGDLNVESDDDGTKFALDFKPADPPVLVEASEGSDAGATDASGDSESVSE